jgi:hypothetical protein
MNSVRCKTCGEKLPLLTNDEVICGMECTEFECEAIKMLPKLRPQKENWPNASRPKSSKTDA